VRLTSRILVAFAGLAVAVSACAPAAPTPLSDPRDILAAAVEHLRAAQGVHVRATIDGSLVLGALHIGPSQPDASAGTGGGLGGGTLSLTGTSFEGDADLAGGRAAIRFAVPALLGITGEVRQLADATYVSSTLTSKGWHRLDASSGLPAAAARPTEWLAALTGWLAEPTIVPARRDDTSCASGSCYVVRLVLGPGEVRALASHAPSVLGEVPEATVTIDLSVDRRALTLSETAISLDLGAAGSLEVRLTFTAWDVAVTVDPPPADQIVTGPLLP
jgi:hypothetical protein